MLGVYVHVPFCERRCDYCDFATWTDRHHLRARYVEACRAELAMRLEPGAAATSVFFGGGTPSLLPAGDLTRVLDAIPRASGCEVTVECNPDSIEREKLAAYRDAGVDRISLGVQSMRPATLAALGRTHDPGNVRAAVDAARAAGITRLNVDLIYGAPGESIDDWAATLDATLDLDPDHVSAYALTVEAGTPLHDRVARGLLAPPDDDDQAAKYELADERLGAAGLEWYEISNWARPGQECRHNLLTWAQGDYLGIGCAAHSHRAGRRSWNLRTPERYLAAVEAGEAPQAGAEDLSPSARADEAVVLALRTRAGVPLSRLGPGPAVRRAVEELEAAGLLEIRDGSVALSRRGRLLASEVSARLLVAGTRYTRVPSGAGRRPVRADQPSDPPKDPPELSRLR